MSGNVPLGARLARSPWLLVLPLFAVALLWAYWPTLASLERRWSTDPQYSHGYVVPVFALIVLWFRRQSFPKELCPSWWGLPLLLLGVLLRSAGAYVAIDWLDALSLVPTIGGVVLLGGGIPLLGWAWPAVAFLLFLLPLPYQVDMLLANPLRHIATVCTTYALQTFGIPAVSHGNVIVIDELKVGVAEACSGLGMLMTFFALSTAVAFIIQRPLRDKVIIFLSAIPVGVLMNVIRITVTVFLFRVASAEVAKAVFHDVAGWIMMPLALAVLLLELRYLQWLYLDVAPAGPIPVAYRLSPTVARPALPVRQTAPRTVETRTRHEPSADRSLLEIPDAAP
jgi:exosortase